MTVTIACPLDVEHPEINSETAPIWTDGVTHYRVASGIIEVGESPDPRILVQVGVDGLTALGLMGLSPLEVS